MNEKKLSMLFVLLLSFVLGGCGKKAITKEEVSDYEKIHTMLLELENFSATATVKYISNKNENIFSMRQFAKITGEYRLEITDPENSRGTITVYDLNQIAQINPTVNDKVIITKNESAERSEIFLTSFIKNYFTSKEVSVAVSDIGDSKCTVLEAVIKGDHPYISTEKLWVDNETKKPVKLEIYDADGTARIIVTYGEFFYNTELDDKIFKIG